MRDIQVSRSQLALVLIKTSGAAILRVRKPTTNIWGSWEDIDILPNWTIT